MAMRFESAVKDYGFDLATAGALPWQMLPVNASRTVYLHEAEGYELKMQALAGGGGEFGGASFTEKGDPNAKKRELVVTASKKGKYELQVISKYGPAVLYSLTIEVMSERKVKAAFYYLPGRDTTLFSVDTLVKKVNEIWNNQANVSISKLTVGDNSSGGGVDLKSEINLAEDKQKLRDYGAHAAADWCVYFGWKIKASEKGTSVLGKTLVDQTVIDFAKFNKGDEAKLAHTLAHELGHFVIKSDPQHDTERTDLMFDTAAIDHSNNKIRKKRCQMVIRP